MSEPSCRLYLVTPVVADATTFAPRLEAALAVGDVACVLLRAENPAALPNLIAIARAHDAAALVADDVRLAVSLDADGVHADGSRGGFDAVLRAMKPARIAGFGRIASRDDAMLAGEDGADYLMFGDEDDPDHLAEPFEDRLERIAWWAEIFEVPCVATALALAEAEAFAAAGADFVAFGAAVWEDPRGAAAAVRDARAGLAAGSAARAARLAGTA